MPSPARTCREPDSLNQPRAKIYGYRNKFAANSIVYHAGSAASGSRYNTFKTKLASRNSVYLIYKNMPALQILLNLPFLVMGFLIKTFFFARKGMGRDYVSGLVQGIRLSASPYYRVCRKFVSISINFCPVANVYILKIGKMFFIKQSYLCFF